MYENNPIRFVDGAVIPAPSSYVWKQEDVSSPGAGRTEDAKMHKLRIGSLISIELSWRNITTETAAQIVAAFKPEYINVCFLNLDAGGKYTTSEFYVGNRSAPMYNSALGVWSNLSFNIIQRECEKDGVSDD